ncbi:MAG: hypothetical protein WBC05_02880 [Sedimentisphaerales bacterium]
MSKSKANQSVAPVSTNSIFCIVKNGNFYRAIKDKTKAISELRVMAHKDLQIDTSKADVKEKNNVIELAGISHWRARCIVVE